MIEVSSSDIKRYVHHVVMHPFEDISEISNMYLDGTSPSAVSKKLTIPELINLSLTKRALIANIIREKTNYDISVMPEEKINIIREKGESLQSLYHPEISVVKEIDIEEKEL